MLKHWDGWILFSLLGLFLIGETVLISVNTIPYLMDSYYKLSIYKKPLLQLFVFLFGFLLAGLLARINYSIFLKDAIPYAVVIFSLGSLVIVVLKKFLLGRSVDRWLLEGSVQPFEFVKVGLVFFLSYYIVRKGNLRKWRHLLWALFFPVSMSFLLLLQPDKGGAVFILLITALMVYVGGVPKRVYLVVIPLLFFFVYYILTSKDYVAERISAWRDPFLDPEDSGYQILQSLYALARGGFMGVGIGQGIQKMGSLPASDTDYAIALLGEEMGFLGVFLVILLYCILIGRILFYSLKTQDPIEKLFLFGIASNFALSFLWNMAMVSNLIPPKGIALPFISYGASNLLASLLSLGLAQSFINHSKSLSLSQTSSSFTPLKHA